MGRAETWARYWESGAAHSLEGSLPPDYGTEIGGWWRKFFASQPLGAAVLDLCTGSGVLCRLALEADRDFSLVGVDLVPTPSPWFTTLRPGSAVEFRGGVQVEALPLSAVSQDVIVSQYGIEYSDLDRSVAELIRVARPKAAVAMILHSVDSRPVDLARRDLPAIEWFLGESGPFVAWKAVIGWMTTFAAGAAAVPAAERTQAEFDRRRFNQASRMIDEVVASTKSDLPRSLMARLAALTQTLPFASSAQRRQAFDALEAELCGASLRSSEMIDCALDAGRAQWLAARLAAELDQPCRVGVVDAAGHRLGWRISNATEFPWS